MSGQRCNRATAVYVLSGDVLLSFPEHEGMATYIRRGIPEHCRRFHPDRGPHGAWQISWVDAGPAVREFRVYFPDALVMGVNPRQPQQVAKQ